MRVRFLYNYSKPGSEAYQRGETVFLDPGIASALIEQGIVEHTPLSDAELDEMASRPYPGDEGRSAKAIAMRVVDLTAILRENN